MSMTVAEIRNTFFEFFESKQHKLVASAPIVLQNDPTLMFTNAGMNQFKDCFLGNEKPASKRVTDTQKCLRVSGKHNDLEEVGKDTYHHTMFEMLGNWSFGDYFKNEAIEWAWELLTDKFGIDKDRLYVTVFEGSTDDNLPLDKEAKDAWSKWIATDRILNGSKKDNFWEMGATGPCGPCSEIHVDIRPEAERLKVDGRTLVNQDHPQVVELWNLVFMQFNRKSDGSLEQLPAQHVDTGMGFERLCMVLQNKTSNYDTGVFSGMITHVANLSKVTYGDEESTDIALRVIVDHIRAITTTIADGQLPSNTGAGYVIRRILRRAVRYGYSFLGLKQPFLHELVAILSEDFKSVFPEIIQQKDFITKVVLEEENAFLRTLETGLKRLDNAWQKADGKAISGQLAFELYDTYGFPFDLTKLIAEEKGFEVDELGFKAAMKEQKDRSRKATTVEAGDWTILREEVMPEFVGYDSAKSTANLIKFRTVKQKKKEIFQVVLDKTPFYAESGGQIGDTGCLFFNSEKINVIDTKKENDLIIHQVDKLPTNPSAAVVAEINLDRRKSIENNHSVTHLLHAALRQVLGTHVQQKGSYVGPEYLRFDFSHFEKVTAEQLLEVEKIVNQKVRQNIALQEHRSIPIADAQNMGAMALFGEKYGDQVRVITFDKDYSVELCGGTHVQATGQIGFFKITAETSVAAGVRRIEAITGEAAYEYIQHRLAQLSAIATFSKNNKDIVKGIAALNEENTQFKQMVDKIAAEQAVVIKNQIKSHLENIDGINFFAQVVDLRSADNMKNVCAELRNEVENLFVVLGAEVGGKALLSIAISDNLVKERGLHAGNLVRTLAKEVRGGGGGQPFFATAGGSDPSGLASVMEKAKASLNIEA